MSLHIHVTSTVNSVFKYIKKNKNIFYTQNTKTSSLCHGLCTFFSGDASAKYNNIRFNLEYLQNLLPGTFCVTLSYFKFYINLKKQRISSSPFRNTTILSVWQHVWHHFPVKLNTSKTYTTLSFSSFISTNITITTLSVAAGD